MVFRIVVLAHLVQSFQLGRCHLTHHRDAPALFQNMTWPGEIVIICVRIPRLPASGGFSHPLEHFAVVEVDQVRMLITHAARIARLPDNH
ncbi:hypothetical protein SAMN05421630_115164 [Prauserella marina]|uniref:Uncharacterized protein n=1 Tax=Prauserella marina TaxID=530584 RepID=A0A1G6Z895_9PSEU|nr:hypothetical protein DES30_112115 [Prauserella marina]SDD98513.1 hypothetical protein SAMN05421630_115164 [Prauserella marina]